MANNRFFAAALEQKKEYRKRVLAEYNARLSEVYANNPRLAEIDREMNQVGASLALTALSGNEGKLAALKEQATALSAEKDKIISDTGIGKPIFECPACNDTGRLSGKLCDCVRVRASRLISEALEREMPISESSFEGFNLLFYPETPDENGVIPRKRMTQIFKFCREYALNFSDKSESIIFIGGAGLGKTHLSLAIVGKVMKSGYDVIYSPSQRLFDAIEKEHFSSQRNEEYLEAVLNCDLLVIDDLGTEFTTSFTQSVIYNIINSRILSKRPTIINTNLSPTELEARYTSRIFSRFIGNYQFKMFCGSDIRQQKALRDN